MERGKQHGPLAGGHVDGCGRSQDESGIGKLDAARRDRPTGDARWMVGHQICERVVRLMACKRGRQPRGIFRHVERDARPEAERAVRRSLRDGRAERGQRQLAHRREFRIVVDPGVHVELTGRLSTQRPSYFVCGPEATVTLTCAVVQQHWNPPPPTPDASLAWSRRM